ncbi:hypothetical protein CCAL13119_06535 [Campylobacter sp. RM13119]|uniref:hypothetical protein n=1 Tax=Campylobacter TaxID=194 RepID=UPI00147620BE|nr:MULTISPECIES: hypothetical protein [unclassified Campylobacter]MBE3606607.1 hypothetical protein [Campylobacter sp. RM13119]
MKFHKFKKAKTLSLANLLSLSNPALANELKTCEFKYISCFEDELLGNENLIRCEIGSVSYVLALLCKHVSNAHKEYFDELDDGLLSGECNVGEEEIKELVLWLKDAKNVIIDSSFFTNPDAKMIFELLEILNLDVILADTQATEYETNGNLSELKELLNFDGSVIYLYKNDSSDEIVGTTTFSMASKIKDGDTITVSSDDFSLTRKFRLDKNLKGTVALVGVSEVVGYNFKLVKVSKI